MFPPGRRMFDEQGDKDSEADEITVDERLLSVAVSDQRAASNHYIIWT